MDGGTQQREDVFFRERVAGADDAACVGNLHADEAVAFGIPAGAGLEKSLENRDRFRPRRGVQGGADRA